MFISLNKTPPSLYRDLEVWVKQSDTRQVTQESKGKKLNTINTDCFLRNVLQWNIYLFFFQLTAFCGILILFQIKY